MSSVNIAPTSASQNGVDWSNPNGIIGSGTATNGITGQAITGTLTASGFPSAQVPGGATINGIEIIGNVWGGGGTEIEWELASLIINSHIASPFVTGNIQASSGSGTLAGSPTTQPGSLSVTAADINTGSITINVAFQGVSGNNFSTVNVQSFSITVFYTTNNSMLPQAITIPARFVQGRD